MKRQRPSPPRVAARRTPAKAKPKRRRRARGKPARKQLARPAADQPANVLAHTMELPVPFLEVVVRERVTEESMMRVFEQVCAEVRRHSSRRVFVDMRESEVHLTISDMAGLAKLIGGEFAGKVDRLALLIRPQDMLAEKFFEPSVSTRGVPTLTTTDLGDAMHWLTASLLPPRS